MNKDFLNSFVNWIIKNNSDLQEFFDETFNIMKLLVRFTMVI